MSSHFKVSSAFNWSILWKTLGRDVNLKSKNDITTPDAF